MQDEHARPGSGFEIPLRSGHNQYQRVPDDAVAARRRDHLRSRTRAVFGHGRLAEMDIMLEPRNGSVPLASLGFRADDPGLTKTQDCLLSPKDSWFLCVWDLYLAALLVLVAVLAPYETAFLVPRLDGLFVFNRFVDLCFFFDMVRK
ncbi:unnamed protein product, partial [Prorocentrum cordatum]